MITASDEATSTVNPSRYHFYLERFLQDDGSICLGFLIVLFAIQQSISHAMNTRTRSPDSSISSGLDSTGSTAITTASNASSGLSSMSGTSSSGGGGNNNSKGIRNNDGHKGDKGGDTIRSSVVPLTQAILWTTLVSILGLIWGLQCSDNAEARALVGNVAPFWIQPDTSQTTERETKPNEGTTSALSSSSQTEESALLERYLKEHEEKIISLPTFTTTGSDTSLDHRKRFAEFIVHPVLLVSGTEEDPDDPSETVAVAVNTDSGSINAETNGIELAQDLVNEILRYRHVERVSIILVSNEAVSKEGCPQELSDLNSSDVPIDCIHIDPKWGHQKQDHVEKLLPKNGFDVSIVLSGCNAKDIQDRIWEKELYEFTDSMVSTCTGPLRTTGRSLTSIGLADQHMRFWIIESLFLENGSSEAFNSYRKIIDYDVRGLNMAVAFHKNMNVGTYKWHCNEANYNNHLSSRLKPGSRDDLQHFEGADMVRIQFPSKQSANSYCAYLAEHGEFEDEEYYCTYGYDPYNANIPIDQIYVGQSTSGENAGRGVFTSVDIHETGTMIGMETNVHSVDYPPKSKAIANGIVDLKVYERFDEEDDDEDDEDDEEQDLYIGGDSVLMTNSLHRAPTTYAEAYGFDDEPWGVLQTSVYSNILTFVNHGCNGTANIGANIPGLNEFTMDTKSPDFKIPDEFLSFPISEYSPHRDRRYSGTVTTSMVEHAPILKDEELFDNYMSFGGEKGFIEQIEELKRDCSGALGTVEQHQLLLQKPKIDSDSNTQKEDDAATSGANSDGSDEL